MTLRSTTLPLTETLDFDVLEDKNGLNVGVTETQNLSKLGTNGSLDKTFFFKCQN